MIYFFRVDSSYHIGNGHILRCIALAKKINKKNKIFFISRNLKGNINDEIIKNEFHLLEIKNIQINKTIKISNYQSIDSEETLNLINYYSKKYNNKTVLIKDSYLLGFRWEKKIYNKVNRLVVIEDVLKKKHYCHCLIDQTYGRKISDYKKLLLPNTKILVGSKYTILRDDFEFNKKKINEIREKIPLKKNILITMGGTDINNSSYKIVSLIKNHKYDKKYNLTLILGKNNPNKKNIIKNITKNKLKINYMVNPKNIAKVFLNSNIAISAGGTTLWELLYLGIPTIVFETASNQKQIIHLLKKDNLILYSNSHLNIKKNLIQVLGKSNNNEKLKKLSKKLLTKFDFKGIHRLIKSI